MVGSGERVFFVTLNSLCILCGATEENAIPSAPGILCAIPYAGIVSCHKEISRAWQKMACFVVFSEMCKKSVCLHAHETDADDADADHKVRVFGLTLSILSTSVPVLLTGSSFLPRT
jgi:hypothetical protein